MASHHDTSGAPTSTCFSLGYRVGCCGPRGAILPATVLACITRRHGLASLQVSDSRVRKRNHLQQCSVLPVLPASGHNRTGCTQPRPAGRRQEEATRRLHTRCTPSSTHAAPAVQLARLTSLARDHLRWVHKSDNGCNRSGCLPNSARELYRIWRLGWRALLGYGYPYVSTLGGVSGWWRLSQGIVGWNLTSVSIAVHVLQCELCGSCPKQQGSEFHSPANKLWSDASECTRVYQAVSPHQHAPLAAASPHQDATSQRRKNANIQTQTPKYNETQSAIQLSYRVQPHLHTHPHKCHAAAVRVVLPMLCKCICCWWEVSHA